MSDEVSQLERQPDSLRSAVDPALEEQQQHQEHLDQADYGDPNMQNGDFSDIDHEHMQDMGEHAALEGLMHEGVSAEGFQPRRGFTHKRLNDPKRNAQGKFLCEFNTCPMLAFDRRCEWSKHMDKHERPYKCQEPGCEKLQGFTYSGGLLRHQREVHKMHGGTRKPLYCPEPNCKRNSGTGFTRKENLSEHIRRVHRRATNDSDMAAQAQNGLDQLEAAAAAAQSLDGDDLTDGEPSAKRKRYDPSLTNGDAYEFNLESESVKRLKNENADLKDRMKQMEEEMAAQRALLQELVNSRQTAPAPTANMMTV